MVTERVRDPVLAPDVLSSIFSSTNIFKLEYWLLPFLTRGESKRSTGAG
jgi:hypothetical protein